MGSKKNRRKWSAAEKLRIVLSGLDGIIEINELCRREGINPTQYCGWKKQLTNSVSQVFGDQRKKQSIHEQRFESELRRKVAARVFICIIICHAQFYVIRRRVE